MTKKADSSETVFAVTVSGELLRMGKTRRRAGYAFGKAPLYFSTVPAEVLADRYLRVREVPRAADMAVIGEGSDSVESPPALVALEQVSEFNKADLVAYAESHGVDAKGSKAEILERIEAYYREKGALGEATE